MLCSEEVEEEAEEEEEEEEEEVHHRTVHGAVHAGGGRSQRALAALSEGLRQRESALTIFQLMLLIACSIQRMLLDAVSMHLLQLWLAMAPCHGLRQTFEFHPPTSFCCLALRAMVL